jgi:hypothetical protein
MKSYHHSTDTLWIRSQKQAASNREISTLRENCRFKESQEDQQSINTNMIGNTNFEFKKHQYHFNKSKSSQTILGHKEILTVF